MNYLPTSIPFSDIKGSTFNISNDTITSKSSITDSLTFTKQLLTPFNNVPQDSGTVEPLIDNSFNEIRSPIQIFNTYIIFEKQDRLLIIDQHAADETVNFEKIFAQITTNLNFESSDLLIPYTIHLTNSEIEITRQYLSTIESYGFKAKLSNNKVQLISIPVLLKEHFNENTFKELLADLTDSSGANANALEKQKEKIVATLACHSSIRAGQVLAVPEMLQLIKNLFNCQLPYSCPHGRPIIWELTKYDLEKNFKRKL